jgi:ABC-type multidrug transport system ATPase subunit
MKVLKMICSRRGTTVVTVIHQPRFEVYDTLDQLLLLDARGEISYRGLASYAPRYFQQLGYELKPHMNPADFVVDTVTGMYKRIMIAVET